MAEPTPRATEPRDDSTGDGPRRGGRSPLIWFSGADPEVLRLSPGDRPRYTGLGGAVLFTAAIAGVSMCIAMRMALGVPTVIAVLIAVGWFLGIANLDRWLVSSMEKPARTTDSDIASWSTQWTPRSPFSFAIPRLLLAVLFGVVISTPITLQIFDSEIQPAIEEIHQREWNDYQQSVQNGTVGRQIQELQGQKRNLDEIVQRRGVKGDPAVNNPDVVRYNEQLRELEDKRNKAAQQGACEEEGVNTGADCRGTSGKAGCGSRCQAYRETLARLDAQIRELRQQRDALMGRLRRSDSASIQQRLAQAKQDLVKVNERLNRLQGGQDTLAKEWQKDNEANDGLLIRMEALNEAAKGHRTLTVAHFFLFLFFAVIECLPVIVKLLMPDSTYEDLARERKRQDKLTGKEELRQRRHTDTHQVTAYYGDRLSEARMATIDEIVGEASTLERDITLRRLHDWYNQQSQGLPPAPPQPYGGQQFSLPPSPLAAPPAAPQQGHSLDNIRLPVLNGAEPQPSAPPPTPGSVLPAAVPAGQPQQPPQRPDGPQPAPSPSPSGSSYPPPSPWSAPRPSNGQWVGGLPHIGVVPSEADAAEPSTGRGRGWFARLLGRRS